jgi:hypothetical protein
MTGQDAFVVTDQNGVSTTLKPVRMSSATMLVIPAQFSAGVTVVSTRDSVPVTTVSINGSTSESRLEFFEQGAWKKDVDTLVIRPDHVAEIAAGSSVQAAIRQARTGSELWPLATVLALACALAEMLVSRYFVRDTPQSAS